MDINAVLFDCDGVILDTFEMVFKSYKSISRNLGGEVIEDFNEFKERYLSFAKYTEFLKSLGIQEKDFIEADRIFIQEQGKLEVKPFEGIYGVLERLSSEKQLVLVTANHREEVSSKLQKLDLWNYFSEYLANDTPGTQYCKSGPIKDVLNKLGVNPNNAIMIGDRTIDYDDSREAGVMNFIFAEYGWDAYTTFNDRKIDFRAQSPMEIIKGVRSIEKIK